MSCRGQPQIPQDDRLSVRHLIATLGLSLLAPHPVSALGALALDARTADNMMLAESALRTDAVGFDAAPAGTLRGIQSASTAAALSRSASPAAPLAQAASTSRTAHAPATAGSPTAAGPSTAAATGSASTAWHG